MPSDQARNPLAPLLPPAAIRLHAHADDWRDAIRQAGDLLVTSGAATTEYTAQMIQAVERYGPYIVIAPGFALAHARASEAVLRTGMSWLSLDEPVQFGHDKNDPVKIVLGLASHGHEEHLAALQLVAALATDPTRMDALEAATTPEELLKLMNQGEDK